MEAPTKRRRQVYIFIILSILLAVFCTISLAQAHSGETLLLTWQEDQDLPELHLTAGETIKGWKKNNIVYFFIPSYVAADKLSLDTNLRFESANTPIHTQSALQYDSIQELLLYDHRENTPNTINICFKHSENLHTVYIHLSGSINSITKDTFTEADIRVVNPKGDIEYNESDNFIKGRGNSTWDLEKKPYYIKLKKKAGLCGMEPDRKWLLLANSLEATKLTNKLFFDFSKKSGLPFSTDSEWIDLYINGEYRGNYLLCEKIDVGTNRVDIANLEQENETIFNTLEPYSEGSVKGYLTDQPALPANITGGYIIEKDVTIDDSPCGFVTDCNNCFVVTSPDNASFEEVSYISSCFQNIEHLLSQQDTRILQYIDSDSFARRFLIEEIALNSDAFITSCYFYKERNDDKIYAGPVWDFDSILGESDSVDQKELGNIWLNYDETTIFSQSTNRATTAALDWDEQLYEIPEYRDYVRETYLKLLPQLETLLYEQIDSYANHIRQSVTLDSIRWDYAQNQAGHYSSFDNNVRYMKFFLAKRINFMNRQFGLETYQYEDTMGDLHKITCLTENGKIDFSVKDGSFLKTSDLPPYNRTKYAGWYYEWDLTPVSEYLPIYEDITLYLNNL